MCSRYSLTSPPEAVRSYFKHVNVADFPPRYNIAPTQPVAIVRVGLRGEIELELVRWGLIPPWVKDPRTFTTLINARSESALEKPSFRGAMRHHRCLVPADGFYEWVGPPRAKRPHLIRPKSGGPIAFAGLWSHWLGADGSEIETMAILTVAANTLVSTVHDRMPVLLAPDQFATWLDTQTIDGPVAAKLLRPAAEVLLEIIEIDPRINNSRNEGADLQRPVATGRLL